jgi:hypothetical protein
MLVRLIKMLKQIQLTDNVCAVLLLTNKNPKHLAYRKNVIPTSFYYETLRLDN